MKLEDQVCSLELAKRLKELGVKQESHFYWVEKRETGFWVILDHQFDCNDRAFFVGYNKPVISAFTVAELGEMLPGTVVSYKYHDLPWCALYRSEDKRTVKREFGLNEADARAKMLIYLIEKGLVKP